MSQPSTAPGGGSDPESRYIPFLNADLDEQDIRDPYAKRLANSDNQLPLSPPPVPQPRNVGSSKTSAIVSFASSSSVTTTGASGSGSTSGSQLIGTTGGNNGANLPVRGGPSTAFGGLVTNASGAPTAAIPGLVFSSRGDNTGSRTQFHAPLEPEVVAKLDDIFFKFLQRICSDCKIFVSVGYMILVYLTFFFCMRRSIVNIRIFNFCVLVKACDAKGDHM